MTNASEPRHQYRPLRVLVLEPEPNHGGGSEAVVLTLARGLARRGHHCELLHCAEGSMLSDYNVIARRVHREPLAPFGYRRPLAFARTMGAMIRTARRSHAHVVLSSHRGYLVPAAALRKLTGVPSCFHLGLPSVGSRLAWRWAYRTLGAGVAPSDHTLSGWQHDGWPRSDLHCIANGVDPDRFAPSADRAQLRRRLDLPATAPLVTFVGRICAQKGVAVLLAAWPEVRRRVPEAQLLIVGGLDYLFAPLLEDALESMPVLDRASVHIREASHRPEDAYAAADVACAPSVGDESFGLTVLEAMACAVPPVASRLGVIDQMLGAEGKGLLVPAGDVNALAGRLVDLLLVGDEARRTLGARLRERAARHYSVNSMIEGYEAILLGLATSAGRKT